jgi:methyl-accepting chemotaxis protein
MPRDIVDYFINVKRPLEIREDVLTTSNDLILLLKRTEKIKTLRLQKKQTLDNVKQLLKEINTMNTQLKHALPRVRIEKPSSPSQQSSSASQQINPNYMNQLKDLQKAISEIEDKLRGF